MLILHILVGVGVLLLGLIWTQLQQISSAIHLVSQQLEELGAPLELQDGILVAARKRIRP